MKTFGVLMLVAFFAALIFAGPLITLWTLNTLFPALAIPYTFKTWLAALVVNVSLAAKVKS